MRRKLIAVIIMLAVAVTATALCLSSCVGELGNLDEVETTGRSGDDRARHSRAGRRRR